MKKILAYGPGLIILAAVLWGIDGILRRGLFDLPASTIVFYEHLIGALLIWPFFWSSWKKDIIKGKVVSQKDWLIVFIVALFSGLLGTLFFTSALLRVNFISFSVVFLLQKLQPIFAIGSARFLLKEKLSKNYAIWAGLAVGAAYFVTFPKGMINFDTGSGTFVAAFLAVGAAFCWGSSTAFSRYLLLRHSHTVVVGLRFLITVPLAFLAVLFLKDFSSLGSLNRGHLLSLVIIALTTGLVALWIYYRGLRFTQAKISTILELAFPFTAVAIDFFVYDTVLAWSQYLAAIVLIFAIYQISRLNVSHEEKN